MRLQAAAGRPEAVRRTLSLLETKLTDLGITPGAQTRHVAASLLGTRTRLSPPQAHRRRPAPRWAENRMTAARHDTRAVTCPPRVLPDHPAAMERYTPGSPPRPRARHGDRRRVPRRSG